MIYTKYSAIQIQKFSSNIGSKIEYSMSTLFIDRYICLYLLIIIIIYCVLFLLHGDWCGAAVTTYTKHTQK